MNAMVVSVAYDDGQPVRCLLTDVVDQELCVSALPVSARIMLARHPGLVGKSLTVRLHPKDWQEPPLLRGVVTRAERLPDQLEFRLKLRGSDWNALAEYWARANQRKPRKSSHAPDPEP